MENLEFELQPLHNDIHKVQRLMFYIAKKQFVKIHDKLAAISFNFGNHPTVSGSCFIFLLSKHFHTRDTFARFFQRCPSTKHLWCKHFHIVQTKTDIIELLQLLSSLSLCLRYWRGEEMKVFEG